MWKKRSLKLKAFTAARPSFFEILRDFSLAVVEHVELIVDGFHNAFVKDEGVHEHHIAVAVHEAVKSVDLTFNEFFHDVIRVRLGFEEPVQVGVALDFVSVGGAHTIVRLGADWIAGFLDEDFGFFRSFYDFAAGHRDIGAFENFLHFGLEFNTRHILSFEAKDVEVRSKLGILLEPVFIVGLNPVDFAVFEGKITAGLEHLAVVFHVVHLEVFGHG